MVQGGWFYPVLALVAVFLVVVHYEHMRQSHVDREAGQPPCIVSGSDLAVVRTGLLGCL